MKKWILSIGAVLLLAFGCYTAYYLYRQDRIKLNGIVGIEGQLHRETGSEMPSDWIEKRLIPELLQNWLWNYTEQYHQPYIKKELALREVQLQRCEVLRTGLPAAETDARPARPGAAYEQEDAGGGLRLLQKGYLSAAVDFTGPAPGEETASQVLGRLDGDTVHADWVLEYCLWKQEDGYCLTVNEQMTPAAYDLMEYQGSGEKAQDEQEQEFLTQTPAARGVEGDTAYRILDDACAVTYDGGVTWTTVPISLEELCAVGDGNAYYNQLQEGSYVIRKERTAFVYGAETLGMIYTEDQGRTWERVTIREGLSGIRARWISFTEDGIGYAAAAYGRTMSQEGQGIYRTADGGKTWAEVGPGPRTRILQDCGYLTGGIGFFCYEGLEGCYRTQDGGATFDPVSLPEVAVDFMGTHLTPFDQPEVPYEEDGVWYMLVGQGPDGDYAGGDCKARLRSYDQGMTWEFTGDLVKEEIPQIG